jgi:signal-transduction protein with cAMP-binding, CBS, and nucleotidyltransferase domain
VSPGDSVYEAGEPAEYMYIVLKGACEEFDESGKLVYRYTEGEYFG